MEEGIIIGLGAGLLGAGVGLFFALYALGFFQYLGGKNIDPRAVDKQTLQRALLSLNDPDRPFRIAPGEISDLMAEWKIVDASWYGIFNKSRLKKAYRCLLLLDEARRSVRCFEIIGTVSWTAGGNGFTPTVHYSKSSFSGRILFQKSYGVGYGIKDLKTLEAGKVYSYRFDIDEIRTPIIDKVKANGWEWIPVTAKRHAVYKLQPTSSKSPRTADSCIQCGAPCQPGSQYCPVCSPSVSVSETAPELSGARTRRRWIPWVLVSAGVVIIVLTSLIMIQSGKRNAQSNNRLPEIDTPKSVRSLQTLLGLKPDTMSPVPMSTALVIDVEASDRFHREGLDKVQAGKMLEGVELFNKALKANPGNAGAWNNLGLAMRKTGKLDEAIKAYRQAIQVQPTFALVHKNFGIALEQAGMITEALQAYLKYVKLNPEAEDVSAIRERVRVLSATK